MHFYTTGQIKFPFVEFFSGTRVNQKVNKCLYGYLPCLCNLLFLARQKKMMFKILLLDKQINHAGNHLWECFWSS